MARMPYAFFYGGYMNPDALTAVGASPKDCETGYVEGFQLTVGPIANLAEKEGARAYGLIARLHHDDLNKLYGGDPAALQGSVYLPEAVLVQTADGRAFPAMTYICPALSGAAADPAYITKLIAAAEKLSLPYSYIDQIRAFAD